MLGQPAIAESHFKRALVLADDADSHFFYARWLASSGRAPEAVPHLRRAVANSPAYVQAWRLLLRLAAAGDQNADLQRTAGEVLAIDPTNADAAAYMRGLSPLRAPEAQAMANGLAAIGTRDFADAAEWYRGVRNRTRVRPILEQPRVGLCGSGSARRAQSFSARNVPTSRALTTRARRRRAVRKRRGQPRRKQSGADCHPYDRSVSANL